MPYFLGVDLGTTYTAAAIHRDGRTSTVDLGVRTAAIPSVVFLRDDETILTGEAASRRGATEPGRVAREFKRRVGDTTPILLGGSPYSADALMGRLLRWVVDAVSEREGEPPSGIAVAHPANWGPYKQELLRQAIARADLDHVVTITEPEAAVTYYASQERVEPGSVIAVYDLGGGTFDAAVVRKTAGGVELLGTPEGIERLGGVDFDEAVFSHVAAALGGALAELDPDDPAAMAAVQRLRAECVEAKEALSADTEVAIPVLLPNLSTEVRLTRAEFEAMIRPPLADSLTAMRRALRSAGVEASGLTAVLLAGGSSRIPLVSQLVSAELGRPVAVDAHPKHGVALGAAQAAAGAAAGTTLVAPPPPPPPPPAPPTEVVAAVAPAVDPPALARLEALDSGPPTSALPPTAVAAATAYEPDDEDRRRSRVVPILAGAIVAAGVAAAAILLLTRDDGDDAESAGTVVTVASTTTAVVVPPPTEPPAEVTEAPVTAPPPTEATTPVTEPPPPPPVCPPDDPRLCIEMTGIAVDGDSIIVDWTPVNFEPAVDDLHAHFFWSTTRAEEAGTNAADFGAVPGVWELTAERPFVSRDVLLLSQRPAEAFAVCVTPATAEHAVVDPGVFHCLPLPG
jgi:actin-like ATPase involved in cell morphogenesis